MKRSFITFSHGEVSDSLCERLNQSINICSKYPLKVYKKSDFIIMDNEEEGEDFWASGNGLKGSIYKILSCLEALEEFDEVVWLDTDCIASHNIDKVWDYKPNDFPLIPKHRFYNFVNWPHAKMDWRHPGILTSAKKIIGCEDNQFENTYLQTCMMVFNKSCKDFYDQVLEYFNVFDKEAFPYGDETIINVLIWKNKFNQNLGDVFLCSYYFSPYIIKSFNEISKEDYPKLFDPDYKNIIPEGIDEDFILSYGKTKSEHNRITLINNNFDDVLFFHGNKSPDLADQFIEYLKNKNVNNMETNQKIDDSYQQMNKLEFMSLSILNGLISNPGWSSYRELDSNELTTKAVELAKMLLEKLNN